jgi:hypothetical protein
MEVTVLTGLGLTILSGTMMTCAVVPAEQGNPQRLLGGIAPPKPRTAGSSHAAIGPNGKERGCLKEGIRQEFRQRASSRSVTTVWWRTRHEDGAFIDASLKTVAPY